MKAIMELGPKKIRLQEQPHPSIQADEILMKVKINGLCQNDVRDYTGDTQWTYPRIGGHEFSGEIAQIGAAVDPE